ncbi:heme-binding protein [Streptomyces sp. NPDC046870]|uniref:GlcG/HbpS family heme-binding protein n=1 Tax=Streptomyces sp. NPDC046870 TaxID=3155135 RepID=UPI0034534184
MPSRTKPSLRTRVLVGGAALAVVGVGVTGTVAAGAAGSTDTTPAAAPVAARNGELTRSTHLTLDAATKAARAAVEAAGKDGRHVSVAVVDRDGNTLVTLRGDGAGPQSYVSAERKAFTAVSWNAPTSELAGRLAQAPTLKDIPGTLFLAGGTPVTAEGAPVAGIGVAGAPSGDLDERYARAGAAVLGR